MTRLKTICLALTALGLTGGAAVAQSTASDPAAQPSKANPNNSGSMGKMGDMSATPNSGSMNMSPTDTATMKSCHGMSHDAMMADAKCKALMAKHSDMMNGDGTMKDMSPPH